MARFRSRFTSCSPSNSTITNSEFGHDQEHEEDSPALVAPEDKTPQTIEEKYREYTKVMQPQW